METAIKEGDSALPLIIDILACEKGCNMGAGCINQRQSITKLKEPLTAEWSLAAVMRKTIKLMEFLDKITKDLDFSYTFYSDLSNNSDIIIPSELQLQQVYKRMYKEGVMISCSACGYNSATKWRLQYLMV